MPNTSAFTSAGTASSGGAPAAHAATHAAVGADAITPASIGAATTAQGTLAGTAVQPAALATAISGVTTTSIGAATTAQGVKADAALPAAQLGQPNGAASLDGTGKLPTAQLPDLAITQYLGSVANQAAMLALTGQRGDWCTRADDGKVYILSADSPALLASWTALIYPASPVTSVAGRTGVVTLTSSDLTDSTAAGRTLVVAADAAAQRTALGVTQSAGAAGIVQASDGTGGLASTGIAVGANGALSGYRDALSLATVGASLTLDLSSPVQQITLTAAVTITGPAAPPAGGCPSIVLMIDCGGFAVTWGANISTPGGTPPTLTTTAGTVNILPLLWSPKLSKWCVVMTGAYA